MRFRHFVICFLLAATTLVAQAFDRQFPQNAKRGTMSLAQYPAIVIDGTTRTLSVGARVWNKGNLTEIPSMLMNNGDMVVNYTEDARGEINKVWILTDDEIKQPPPSGTN
jgi:hypothetical protein